MKNYANRFPLPTGNIWGRLPERVTAQETKSVALEARVAAIEKNPLVYKTIFSQASTSAPAPVAAGVSKNTTNSIITFGYSSAGTYTITSSLPIFTAGKTHVVIGTGESRVATTAAVTSTTVITITSATIGTTPTLTNGLFTNTPISIEIFN
jgi:hypothetical protein